MPKKAKKGRTKKIKSLSAQTRRVFAESDVLIMLEDMNDNIKIIAEGQIGLREDLNSFKEEMHEFKDEMYSFRDEMCYFRNEMHSFRDEMYSFRDEMHEFRNLALEDLDEIKNRLNKVEKEMIEIKKQLSGKANKEWVEERIVFLEREIEIIKQVLAVSEK